MNPDAWAEVQRRLVAAGLDPAPREGQALVAAAGGDDATLAALLTRRLQGEPLAYVVGRQPFWSRDWRVGPAVLIPRPDSEALVQAVLDVVEPQAAARVAEVGVGSGALLGSVLLERPAAQGVGTELMPEALAVARQNLAEAGVLDRAALHGTAYLAGVAGAFDVIFANPPYLSAAEYAALEPAVRGWEPQAALVGGASGLACYEALTPQAWAQLRGGGVVCAGNWRHPGGGSGRAVACPGL